MIRIFLAFLLLLALPSPAFAEDGHSREDAALERAAQVQYVMLGTMAAEDVFAPSFLSVVPVTQMEAIARDLVAQNGPLLTADEISYKGDGEATFDLVFEKARAAATLYVAEDEPHLIVGFRIGAVTPVDDTPQKIFEDFAALPGRAGFGVFMLTDEGPQSVLTNKAYQQFAIGSTFKLYVLAALARKVAWGEQEWGNVVPLSVRSVPSGQLQDWPQGSPVTLHTLATMMISISDNTATDALIGLMGREAVEAELIASKHSDPSATMPMLSTVEFFALKSDPARTAAYAAADDAGKRALLAEWAPVLTAENVDGARLATSGPTAIDSIEWFASTEDIAGIFTVLRDFKDPTVLDILAVNPLISGDEAANWDYVGYKGGSESGVLNLSWLLKDRQERWFVISASWNDPAAPVDLNRFVSLARRLAGMLRQ